MDDDDDGLPDEAFTEDELAAGVQHIMRSGSEYASSSRRRHRHSFSFDDLDNEEEDESETNSHALRFESFAKAQAWARSNPGRTFTRAVDGHGFEATPIPGDQIASPFQSNGTDAPHIPKGRGYESPKKKQYPADNPASSTWIPGTNPITPEEEELFDVDMENKRRIFWPRLKKLAPSIYQRARNGHYDLYFFDSMMSGPLQKSQSELFQLLALLEAAVERSRRWYMTSRYSRGGTEEMVNFVPPQEVIFWEECLEAVVYELILRE